MLEKIVYTTEAQATGGGRDGKSALVDGKLAVTLAPPKEMGGSGNGNNPEQLFAVGYAACYLGALRYAAGAEKLGTVPPDATVNVAVSIGPRTDGGFGIAAKMTVHLPGVEKTVAEKMVERGHFTCPYSNATKGNISVETVITG